MASYYPGSDRALTSCGRRLGAKGAERAVGYELWLLVHDEVPGLWNELQLECVGSGGLLANGSGRSNRVPRSDEEQRGHLEGHSGVASGRYGHGLAQQKGPVEQLAPRARSPFRRSVKASISASENASNPARSASRARLHRPSPQLREGQRDLVRDPPGLEYAAAISGGPRRHDGERHGTPDPFRPTQAEEKGDPAAPVMANQIDPVQLELVEQQARPGPSSRGRSLGPAPRSSQTRVGPGTAPGYGERAAASPDATGTSAAASRGASRSACPLPPRPGASADLPH
jgi:hypothetical protein